MFCLTASSLELPVEVGGAWLIVTVDECVRGEVWWYSGRGSGVDAGVLAKEMKAEQSGRWLVKVTFLLLARWDGLPSRIGN